MAKFKSFRQGEMLEARNAAGELIAWGSFETEDKDYTFLKMVQGTQRRPFWKFDIGRYPNSQFAFIRMPDKIGDFHLLTRTVVENVERFGNQNRSRDIHFPPYHHRAEPILFDHPRFGAQVGFRAATELEYKRLLDQHWHPLKLHFDREEGIYRELHGAALTKMLMNPQSSPELVIARCVRGTWNIQSRDRFLDAVERLKSPFLSLLQEVLGAKKLKNEGEPRPERDFGL